MLIYTGTHWVDFSDRVQMTPEQLKTMADRLMAVKRDDVVSKLRCRQSMLDGVRAAILYWRNDLPSNLPPMILGIPVVIDPTVPDGFLEWHYSDGRKELKRIW